MNSNQRIIKEDVEIFYPELSFEVVGIIYKVHDTLGRFCKEKQYCDAFEEVLKSYKIRFSREVRIPIQIEGRNLEQKADFIIEGVLVLEVKAKTAIERSDYAQVHRYLQAGNFKLGILVNFRNRYIKPIRILNSCSQRS